MTALVVSRAARVALDGELLLEMPDASAEGPLVVLSGAFEPLFRLLTRRAELAGGTLDVANGPAVTAVREGRLGLALAEPALPETFDVRGSLVAAARLAGLTEARAKEAARAALELLGLEVIAKRKTKTLSGFERRALSLAHGALLAPPVVAVERPFDALEDADALRLERLLERVRGASSVIVHFGSPRSTGPEARVVAAASAVVTAEGAVRAARA